LRLGCVAEPSVDEALAARLGRFPQLGAGPCDLQFEFVSEARGKSSAWDAAPGDARIVYESPVGQVLYSEGADRLHVKCTEWPISAVSHPPTGKTSIAVDGPCEAHLWALSHPLLTIPLIEALKRRKHYSVHAAALARGARGLVISGSSGSGKSTLALALVRAGFDFMGDDMLFLTRSAAGLQALALPEAFDLTEHSVGFFPELSDLLESRLRPGWPKHQLHVDERFGAKIAWRCEPRLLVFPRVASSGKSVLTVMPRNQALMELLPNVLLTDGASSQEHLEACSALVQSTACYRLETGTDFDELAKRLGDLLEGDR
jgi:hypothetical protein